MIGSLSPRTKPVIVLVVSVMIFGFAGLIAYANGPAPPSFVWFRFNDQTSQDLRPEGLQLIGCEAAACGQPILLEQYGICDAPDCLPSLSVLGEWPNLLQCAENRCRASIEPFTYDGLDFRIVAQFPDGTRASGVIGKLPEGGWGEEEFWQIIVHDAELEGIQDASFANKRLPLYQFFTGFVLTQLAEAAVAALYCRLRLKMNLNEMLGAMLRVFLINLATFPVVWLLFPHLERLALMFDRVFGICVLGVAIVYAVLLVSICRAKDKKKRIPIELAAIIMIVAIFGLLVSVFTIGYAARDFISTTGVSFLTATVMAEIFAVIAETLLIFLCSRERISPRHSAELSLAINVVSLLLGILVWQAF